MNDVVVYSKTRTSLYDQIQDKVASTFILGSEAEMDVVRMVNTRVLFYCWSEFDDYLQVSSFLELVKEFNAEIVVCLVRDKKSVVPFLHVDFVYIFDSSLDYVNALSRFFHFTSSLVRLKGPKGAKNILTIGNLRLDVMTYSGYINESKISISRTEFQILRALISQKESVVRFESLVSSIWKNEVSTDRLYVHIYNLRKKLVQFDGCIQSVHGVGFRILQKKV